MKQILYISCITLLLSSLTFCNKEPINKTVIGTISSSLNGAPVVGAKVKMNNQVSTTDEEGEYSFDIRFDKREIILKRTLNVSAQGFYSASQEINFNSSKDSRRSSYNISIDPESYLVPKNGKTIRINRGANKSSLKAQNSGSREISFNIESLDEWLEVSPEKGKVAPSDLIEFTIETDTTHLTCSAIGTFIVYYANYDLADTYQVEQPIFDNIIPFADFHTEESTVTQFDTTWFNAVNSDDNCSPKSSLRYSWDYKGDGNWTVPNAKSLSYFIYQDIEPITVFLRVYDEQNNEASTSRKINVQQAAKAPTLNNLTGKEGLELLSLNVECNLTDLGFPLNPGVVKHGFVISGTTDQPSLSNYQKKIELNQKGNTGLFSGVFSDLNPGIKYWVRAYADNGKTRYSAPLSFTPKILELSSTITVTDFNMGSNLGDADNQPVFKATIDKSYQLSKTEITVGQFVAFLNAKNKSIQSASQIINLSDNGITRLSNNRYDFNASVKNKPIRYVNYLGATEFCQWAGGRLPTEAEWEYAARGGSQFGLYSGSDNVGNAAYYSGNSTNVGNVGLKGGGNIFGLFDMSGNVEEWVFDYYSSTMYQTYKNDPNPPVLNPTGPISGTYRIVRGGHYSSSANQVRVFARNYRLPAAKSAFTGFRCLIES